MTVIYRHQNERGKIMILFSKVKLRTSEGETTEFLCTGTPRKETDLHGWTAFEDFTANHRGERITAEVEAYSYGDGEEFIATIYEVASYTKRGERFFQNPNVRLRGKTDFTF